MTVSDAHHAGRLQAELARLGRYPLIVAGEAGDIPFQAEAATLFVARQHHGTALS